LVRRAQLANDDHVQRRRQCKRDLERHGNPAAWQPEYDDVVAGTTDGTIGITFDSTIDGTIDGKVPEQAGQPTTGIPTIVEAHRQPVT
jgi:hypothetical protein